MFRTALLLPVLGALAPTAQDDPPPPDTIPWVHAGLDAALARARDAGGGAVVYFWVQGSEYCSRFYGETLCRPEASQALAGLACVSADVGSAEGSELLARYAVTTLPAMLFLRADGVADDVILGHIVLGSFVGEVARIRAGDGTVSDLEAQVAACPTHDLALLQRLANKLADVGRAADSAATIATIKEADPEGRTEVGARLYLGEARDAVAAAADPNDPRTWELAPLYRHVRGIEPAAVALEGWTLLADLELGRGERAKAFEAFRSARPVVDDARLPGWGARVVETAWAGRDDLRRKDERFVLEVAQAVVAVLEAAQEEATDAPEATDDAAGGEGEGPPALDPDAEEEPLGLAGGLDLLARAQMLNGRRAKALAAIDRAIELEPGSARWRDRRAELERR